MARHNILAELVEGRFDTLPGKKLLGGVVRCPEGLFEDAPWQGTPQMLYHEFKKDFILPWNANNWDINTVETGSGTASEGTGDSQFGVLTLTNDDADDDCDQIIAANETFKFTSGNPLWFECRAKASVTSVIDLSIGLIASEDLTAVGDNMPADGAVWYKDDGDTNLDFCSAKDGTNDNLTGLGTLTTGWHTYGFYFNGNGAIDAFLDGTKVGTVDTTICDDEEVAPMALVRNGDGNARNLKIDYFLVRQLR